MVSTETKYARPTVICLVPIKNEAWILGRCLACASQWADHIIVADQCSTDESRAIVARYPRVTLVENTAPAYDEGARQRLLIDAARHLVPTGRRLLLALDADEMLTANWATSSEWEQMLAQPDGTVFGFEWVNIKPAATSGSGDAGAGDGFRECWIPGATIPFGFMDDGSTHTGEKIHSHRLPTPADAPTMDLREIKLLHYQYTSWQRMESKQRWYQCWERLNFPDKRAIAIYRQYHHMDAWSASEIHPIQAEWLAGYQAAGIDMTRTSAVPFTWWDADIVGLLEKHGAEHFRRIAIWDVDWVEMAQKIGLGVSPERLRDPRNGWDRRVHRWLAATQAQSLNPGVRWMQRALRLVGW